MLVRYLLLVPHFLVLLLLGIATEFVLIAAWFAALVTGRLPSGIARFLTGFLGYSSRLGAAAMLLVDRYPPFALTRESGYPVRIGVRPGALNRWAVLFRIILFVPAGIIRSLALTGWSAASVVIWLVVLVLGRMPRALFEATSAVLRFSMRCDAYFCLLSSAYPKRLFGDDWALPPAGAPQVLPGEETRQPPPGPATRPLLMSTAGKTWLAVFLALGLIYEAVSLTRMY